MIVGQTATSGYVQPFAWSENSSVPTGLWQQQLTALPAEQEPARKMGHCQRGPDNKANASSLTNSLGPKSNQKSLSCTELGLLKCWDTNPNIFTWGNSVSSTACVPRPNGQHWYTPYLLSNIYANLCQVILLLSPHSDPEIWASVSSLIDPYICSLPAVLL